MTIQQTLGTLSLSLELSRWNSVQSSWWSLEKLFVWNLCNSLVLPVLKQSIFGLCFTLSNSGKSKKICPADKKIHFILYTRLWLLSIFHVVWLSSIEGQWKWSYVSDIWQTWCQWPRPLQLCFSVDTAPTMVSSRLKTMHGNFKPHSSAEAKSLETESAHWCFLPESLVSHTNPICPLKKIQWASPCLETIEFTASMNRTAITFRPV